MRPSDVFGSCWHLVVEKIGQQRPSVFEVPAFRRLGAIGRPEMPAPVIEQLGEIA